MRKGAVVLSLLLLVLLSPLSAKNVYVNDYAVAEPYVEVSFLKQPSSTDKSDAAMVVCYGKSGTEVYTIDGGRANGTLLTALSNLRSDLLGKLGFSDKTKDPAYKLRITCLVSHCHIDHVGELTDMLFSSPRFSVDALFLPEATMLSDDGSYDNAVNCDLNERPALLAALGKWHPEAKVIQVPFGTKMEIPLDNGGVIRLFAPSCDWGTGEPLEYIRKVYYGSANALKVQSDVPLAVLNSNSMWMQVEVGGRKILFTGDVLKKKDLDDEPFDRMVAFYGVDTLRSDVVKYPHHGISRDSAAEPLRDLLMDASSFVVVTAISAKRKSGPILDRLGIPWLDASAKDVVFRMEGDSLLLE